MTNYRDLATEQANPATARLDRATPLEIVQLFVSQDRVLTDAVAAAAESIAALLDDVATRLERGGRLIYVGAGTSGRLGALDAAECPPTFGVPPTMVQAILAGGSVAMASANEGAEDDPEAGAAAVREVDVGPDDLVLGISASGTAQYVLGALAAAADAGAATGLLLCNAEAPVPAHLDHVVRVAVGPEVLAGSTRLKAGTATKMVLNIITTGAMARLGKVYRNLMVDVKATNRKLRDRARRILQAATDLDDEAAASLLAACPDLKVAIVMARLGLDEPAARQRLHEYGGRVAAALGELS